MEETTAKYIDLNINNEGEELIEMLNTMCIGANKVFLGTLLAGIQERLENGTVGTVMSWGEF